MTYQRDAAGRVTEQTGPRGRTTGFQYDAEGRLTAITPPGRSAHVFSYNGRDNRESYTPPDLSGTETVTRYTYNRDQQVTQIERPTGATVDFAYDSGGRRSSVTLPRGASYDYGYDADTGQRTSLTAPGGQSLDLSFDGPLLTQSQWSGAVNGTVSREVDANFWLTTLSVNGRGIDFAYDDDGLLTQAGSLSLTRDPEHGLLNGTTLANMSDTWSYNAFGEVSDHTAAYDGSTIYAITYSRDKLGRITEADETTSSGSNTTGYTYDEAGRLTEVTADGTTVHMYDYGPNGNRLEHTGPSGTTTADYDAQDRLTRYGDTSYSYNAAGDLKSKSGPHGTTSYDYDALGNLRGVELPDGTQIDYVIDGKNRRVGKKVDGQLQKGWLYKDGLNPVAQVNGDGEVTHRFVYGAKANVPAYMIKIDPATGEETTYRLISDHRGSVRLVVNVESGEIAQRLDYTPFGKVTTNTNPGFQPFGFAGGLYDMDTGLVRFGARDYDPETGRWTAKDPILFAGGSTNLYGYVVNDPLNALDPKGLAELPVGQSVDTAPPAGSGTAMAQYSDIREDMKEEGSVCVIRCIGSAAASMAGGEVAAGTAKNAGERAGNSLIKKGAQGVGNFCKMAAKRWAPILNTYSTGKTLGRGAGCVRMCYD